MPIKVADLLTELLSLLGNVNTLDQLTDTMRKRDALCTYMHVCSVPRTAHKNPVQPLTFRCWWQEIGSVVVLSEYSSHSVVTVAPEKQKPEQSHQSSYCCTLRKALLLTVEFTVDLGSSFRWESRPSIVFDQYTTTYVGLDSAVGTETHCKLDGPEMESWSGRDFPHPSKTVLRPTQPPILWIPSHCAR
jgi:hypothetical protein